MEKDNRNLKIGIGLVLFFIAFIITYFYILNTNMELASNIGTFILIAFVIIAIIPFSPKKITKYKSYNKYYEVLNCILTKKYGDEPVLIKEKEVFLSKPISYDTKVETRLFNISFSKYSCQINFISKYRKDIDISTNRSSFVEDCFLIEYIYDKYNSGYDKNLFYTEDIDKANKTYQSIRKTNYFDIEEKDNKIHIYIREYTCKVDVEKINKVVDNIEKYYNILNKKDDLI
ncbi:MAG: hypothetical protein E7160_01865 [Firmicutes bacterium]|nr:hypothetical protein [Bacillota bacterium]